MYSGAWEASSDVYSVPSYHRNVFCEVALSNHPSVDIVDAQCRISSSRPILQHQGEKFEKLTSNVTTSLAGASKEIVYVRDGSAFVQTTTIDSESSKFGLSFLLVAAVVLFFYKGGDSIRRHYSYLTHLISLLIMDLLTNHSFHYLSQCLSQKSIHVASFASQSSAYTGSLLLLPSQPLLLQHNCGKQYATPFPRSFFPCPAWCHPLLAHILVGNLIGHAAHACKRSNRSAHAHACHDSHRGPSLSAASHKMAKHLSLLGPSNSDSTFNNAISSYYV